MLINHISLKVMDMYSCFINVDICNAQHKKLERNAGFYAAYHPLSCKGSKRKQQSIKLSNLDNLTNTSSAISEIRTPIIL